MIDLTSLINQIGYNSWMSKVYSTYEAKAKFSEILRRVRAGARVRISYHGEEVAEVRPLSAPQNLEGSLRRMEEEGVVSGTGGSTLPKPLAKRPGALARFLGSRD